MKHTTSLTQGNILQVLLRFSIPFLLANLLQALYGAADLMIIGAYCPAESIAAVSTGHTDNHKRDFRTDTGSYHSCRKICRQAAT